MKQDKDYATKALRARLVAAGVDPEKFDVHANVDRRLSQRENFLNLTQMTGSGKRKEHDPSLSKQTSKKALDEWRQIGRTHKEVDKKLKAKLPGVRYVKHPGAKGTKYTERRKNRSDRPSGWI